MRREVLAFSAAHFKSRGFLGLVYAMLLHVPGSNFVYDATYLCSGRAFARVPIFAAG